MIAGGYWLSQRLNYRRLCSASSNVALKWGLVEIMTAIKRSPQRSGVKVTLFISMVDIDWRSFDSIWVSASLGEVYTLGDFHGAERTDQHFVIFFFHRSWHGYPRIWVDWGFYRSGNMVAHVRVNVTSMSRTISSSEYREKQRSNLKSKVQCSLARLLSRHSGCFTTGRRVSCSIRVVPES